MSLAPHNQNSHGGEQTRTDELYWVLRHEIVRGVLRPNALLVESDLAERLKVSRTPIREVMQRLALDGLIVSRRRRWAVYEHSRDEVIEIYETRAALEGFAARLASERATDTQLTELLEFRSAATTLHNTPSGWPDRVEINERFHDLIAAAAQNRRITRLIESNRLFYFNYGVAVLYTERDLEMSSMQHLDLINAVCARDGRQAEEITREHINHALGLILDRLYRGGDVRTTRDLNGASLLGTEGLH